MSLLARCIEVGASLISEDGENPEYDRAIAEFTIDVCGLTMDHKDDVLAAMKAYREVTFQ